MWSFVFKSFIPVYLMCLMMGQHFAQNQPSTNEARIADRVARISDLPDIAKGPNTPVGNDAAIFTENNAQITRTTIGRQTIMFDNALRQSRAQPQSFLESVPFNPSTVVNDNARDLGRTGAIFTETSIALSSGTLDKATARSQRRLVGELVCRFKEPIQCDYSAKYRTSDGSCNNIDNPIWGRSNSPFERFLPPNYDDGFNNYRQKSVTGSNLPLPRVVSTRVHQASSVADLHHDINHLTMEFGQFVSHDVNSNAQSSGEDGSPLVCCKSDGTVDDNADKQLLGCLPIVIPNDDPYFRQFNKRCMNFVRAMATTDLNCTSGFREQLNQVTHCIDGSTVYGSDASTTDELRSKTDGLLKVTPSPNGDLLLQNPGGPGCRGSSSTRYCFKTGEARSNQQPALMTLHTLFLREHNRVARELKRVKPTWDDEKLFQEARKVVGAEIQHITYTYYLPAIMGNAIASRFGFGPQAPGSYFTGYDPSFRPSIRNSFAAAAYRFGHSTVRDRLAPNHILKDHYINPDMLYDTNKGPSYVTRNLIDDRQQQTDNLLSSQLTNHMFERAPGSGVDLASINIKRGRDHGLPAYNFWRVWCGLPRATSFSTEQGGLVDHVSTDATLLGSVYSHPDDIDIWTGIVTEMPLEGRALGPTGACMIGRQFWTLKHADRFYYETNDNAAKFNIEQLDEIRKTTLARIICDNTDLGTIPGDVFHEESSQINPAVSCTQIPGIDFSKWSECEDKGWSVWSRFSQCEFGRRFRSRRCLNECSTCPGDAIWIVPCRNRNSGFPFRR